MALKNSFYDAVKDKNIRRLRIMMSDSLLVDPTFREFTEMDEVASSVEGLYEPFDGRPLETDESNWNDDYMSKQMVQVVSNFSHERIEHLKSVIRYLRPVTKTVNSNVSKASNNPEVKRNMSYEEQKRQDQLSGRYRGVKIATGAVAGAVVGGVIASATEVTVAEGAIAGVTVVGGTIAGAVVGGAIVGAVVGGVAVAVITNGGD
ncbi:hypothetical protein [Inconstantimicrobium porci]|uniref:Uncharacterized protein n=1 Tax=Inconstantimicrobium porci TaxID=2652291 RepID=A0A7X2T2J5_9CLOT|nr:hypothetical protein [Inconstantimicrobium porci]MSR92013.1 hypothetical protein [Inconstantimicrobium porci]